MGREPYIAWLGLLVGAATSCFVGEGTVGAVCASDSDCGAQQSCRNGLCGRCGNAAIDAGELCLGDPIDRFVEGNISSMTAVDLDADGDDDLVAAVGIGCDTDPTGTCSSLAFVVGDLESGDYVVSFPIDTVLGAGSAEIDAVDLDGDSAPDFLLAPSTLPGIGYVFGGELNDLDGPGGPAPLPSIRLIDAARSLQTPDVDGDGDPDVVCGHRTEPFFSVARFQDDEFMPAVTFPTLDSPRLGPLDDYDGDGVDDVVVVSASSSRISVHSGNGDGTFQEGVEATIPGGYQLVRVDAGDLDGDGLADVVSVDTEQDALVILRNRGNATFEADPALRTGSNPLFVAVADLNADGALDILVSNTGEDNLSFFPNRGGEFPDTLTIDVGVAPDAVLTHDFNHDGAIDIALGSILGTVSIIGSEP